VLGLRCRVRAIAGLAKGQESGQPGDAAVARLEHAAIARRERPRAFIMATRRILPLVLSSPAFPPLPPSRPPGPIGCMRSSTTAIA
jgi:hypothetical protein